MSGIEQRWLNIADAAKYTGRGKTTVRYAAQAGELRGIQAAKGKTWTFEREDLDRWVRGEAPREDAGAA